MANAHRVKELLTTGNAAALLGVSTTFIVELEREGLLVPVAKTPSGLRLFERSTVERYKNRRARKLALVARHLGN